MTESDVAASSDIFFACPSCGKNMCIPREGIGLLVTCPQCEKKCRVPAPTSDPTEDTVVDVQPTGPSERDVVMEEIAHVFDLAEASAKGKSGDESIWDCVVSRENLGIIFDEMAKMHTSLARVQEILEKAMEG